MPVSFFMAAYNCECTVRQSVASILLGNFEPGDELIIADDASIDGTAEALQSLREKYPAITIVTHSRNKGGGAARNAAIEHARHPLLFCLDSDNLLEPGSVSLLCQYRVDSGADVAAFQTQRFFQEDKSKVTHEWKSKFGEVTLADYLSGQVVPGAGGNYLFTRRSWEQAGGYPEFAGALDTWGFGLRQLASGAKMMVMPDSHYYHRYGHNSYWMRDSKEANMSLRALQLLIPHLSLIAEEDVDYLMGPAGRYTWFDDLNEHPIRLKSQPVGHAGTATVPRRSLCDRFRSILAKRATPSTSARR